VLVDGRSVYNEFYSGVFWDKLNIPVDDIERIEVIRGRRGHVGY
jgi:iron complex outermembrane receptor protein